VFHAHFWGAIALHKRYAIDVMHLHLPLDFQRVLRGVLLAQRRFNFNAIFIFEAL
jgi:hypothetical protein